MTPLSTGTLAQLDAKISETNFQPLIVLCIETSCMDHIGVQKTCYSRASPEQALVWSRTPSKSIGAARSL